MHTIPSNTRLGNGQSRCARRQLRINTGTTQTEGIVIEQFQDEEEDKRATDGATRYDIRQYTEAQLQTALAMAHIETATGLWEGKDYATYSATCDVSAPIEF